MATDEENKRRKKRITMKPKTCPNPLFEKWLEEWKNEAAMKGTDMQYCFGKALASLRKYPLLLKTGRDCGVLNYFGNRLCIMLDRRLAEYRKDHPEGTDEVVIPATEDPVNRDAPAKPKKQKKNTDVGVKRVRKEKVYLPAWRTGPYALLLTLLEESQNPGYPGFLTKKELQRKAQPLCDKSFTKPDPGSHYTAWSSMSTLLKKGLVHRHGCPAKFNLTDAGTSLALRLQDVGVASTAGSSGARNMSIEISDDECASSSSAVASSSQRLTPEENTCSVSKATLPGGVKRKTTSNNRIKPTETDPVSPSKKRCKSPVRQEVVDETVILVPWSFDVVLLVDKQETAGGTGLKNLLEDATVSELTALRVPFELRHLKVGDFAWICRAHATGQELMLPYIVERKRMDDLAKSIKDGRFHEQKFRLKQCRIENLIYLVESHGDNLHTTLPLESLQQAAINTQIVDGFTVKTTSNHRNSMRYLATMTRLLAASYQNKTVVSCRRDDLPPSHIGDDLVSLMTFLEFNSASSKTKALGVQDMFMKQLVQLSGLSVEKAQAIVDRYPTPRVLMAAYQTEGDAGNSLLAGIRYGALKRLIGPVTSKAIHQFYTTLYLS